MAYKNSTLILAASATAVGLLGKGIHGIYEYVTGSKPDKAAIKQELNAVAGAKEVDLEAQ